MEVNRLRINPDFPVRMRAAALREKGGAIQIGMPFRNREDLRSSKRCL